MSSKKDDEVRAAETYSVSSHEAEDDCDNDDDVDDDDDAVTVNDADDKPFWRQHWLAVVVAVLAASATQYFRTQPSETLFPFLERSSSKHAHLDSFDRTANISFCTTMPNSKGTLDWMEFYIPQEYFETLKAFYLADDLKDDYYDLAYFSIGGRTPLQSTSGNPEFQCLLEQGQRPHASGKFKGTTYHYKTPTMEQIYPQFLEEDGSVMLGGVVGKTMSRQRRLQQPPLTFTGFASKFVNLSPKPVLLWWDGKGGHEQAKKLVGEIGPLESLGTATVPGHSFHVTPVFDSSTALQRWVLTADTALTFYEPETPEGMRHALLESLDEPNYALWGKYQRQLVNKAFARDYLVASKRTWLSHFPRRFPMHHMHEASYIGQRHQVGDFSLEVVSVTPRVFVIDNLLSPEDCQSIIDVSQAQGLEHSTLHSGATAKQTRDLSTRSSSNTWLPRDTNALTERVYKQAAQLMGLDPELFQKFHDSSPHHHSLAESLQVVRYKKTGEEYSPHHDFVYPSINHRYQPTRFATLLVYLNDVPQGGETRFPRAVNNYNAEGLVVKPKVGRAVLFYNLLEDGNVDDLSQHGSNPTQGYEKWLANLWVWDPVID
jgi:prolyl 4-hydroxylase